MTLVPGMLRAVLPVGIGELLTVEDGSCAVCVVDARGDRIAEFYGDEDTALDRARWFVAVVTRDMRGMRNDAP